MWYWIIFLSRYRWCQAGRLSSIWQSEWKHWPSRFQGNLGKNYLRGSKSQKSQSHLWGCRFTASQRYHSSGNGSNYFSWWFQITGDTSLWPWWIRSYGLSCKQTSFYKTFWFKPVLVKTNSGYMHLTAVDHVGATVLAHVVCSPQMHLTAVIFNWKAQAPKVYWFRNWPFDFLQIKMLTHMMCWARGQILLRVCIILE